MYYDYIRTYIQINGGDSMDYKKLIKKLVDSIETERTLKIIYRFIKGILD